MLSKEDLELLRGMMREEINTAVTASESRMTQAMHTEINTAVAASESRMTQAMHTEINTAVTASESRTKTEIMAYIESHVEKEIHAIADGHLMLAEKMDRMQANMETMQADIDEIKATVTAHDIIITSRYRQAK